jgi:hypothetical protein
MYTRGKQTSLAWRREEEQMILLIDNYDSFSMQEIVPVVYGNPSRRLRKGKITQHLYEAYQRCTGRRGEE